MIEKIEFAFKLIGLELKEFLKINGFKPFVIKYNITDFENRKDYELILTLKEVKK